MVVDHPHQLVDEEGLGGRAIVPGGGALAQAAAYLLAPALQRLAQQLHHAGPGPAVLAGGHGVGNGLAEHAAVDNRALVGNADRGHRGSDLRAGWFSPCCLGVSAVAA